MKSLIIFLVVGFLASVFADSHTCDAMPQDDTVYSFAYGHDWLPHSAINDKGEVYGFAHSVIRAVCEVMNKNCVHIAHFDFDLCWDSTKHSQSLYNGWWNACVGYSKKVERLPAVGFAMEFANRPAVYMYVRRGARVDTVDAIRSSSTTIGFVEGSDQSPKCLENFLGRSLAGRIVDTFESTEEMADALDEGDIDVMFLRAKSVEGGHRFQRVASEPINCALSGYMLMMRKDMVHKFGWMEEGFQKIRDNGDYDWFCNNAERDGDAGCSDF